MGEGIQATVPSNSDIVVFFEGTRFRKNTDPQDQDLQGSNSYFYSSSVYSFRSRGFSKFAEQPPYISSTYLFAADGNRLIRG